MAQTEEEGLQLSSPVRLREYSAEEVTALQAMPKGTLVFNTTTQRLMVFTQTEEEGAPSAKRLAEETEEEDGGGDEGAEPFSRRVGDIFFSFDDSLEEGSDGKVLRCKGQVLSQALYPALFSLIGISFAIPGWTDLRPSSACSRVMFSTSQQRWVFLSSTGTIRVTNEVPPVTPFEIVYPDTVGNPGDALIQLPVAADFQGDVIVAGTSDEGENPVGFLKPDNTTGLATIPEAVQEVAEWSGVVGGDSACILVGESGHIVYSLDGETFTAASGDVEARWKHGCYDSARDRFLVFGSKLDVLKGASRSTDGTGSLWKELDSYPFQPNDVTYSVSYSPSLDRIIVLTRSIDTWGDFLVVRFSDDGGDTWQFAPVPDLLDGRGTENVVAVGARYLPIHLVWDPITSHFMGVTRNTVCYSRDGITWTVNVVNKDPASWQLELVNCAPGVTNSGRFMIMLAGDSEESFSFVRHTSPIRYDLDTEFAVPHVNATPSGYAYVQALEE